MIRFLEYMQHQEDADGPRCTCDECEAYRLAQDQEEAAINEMVDRMETK